MQKISNKLFYFVLLIIWILLLFLLTPMIFLFVDENKTVSKIPIDLTGDTVYYAIDYWLNYDNIFPMITIDGWTFVETEKDNINKIVKLIFVSDDTSYEIDADTHNRQGVIRVYADKNVPKERLGFSSKFSPLRMKNDDYTLYFYVFENENNFGIINTGRVFRKYYRNFTEIKGGEKVKSEEFAKSSVNGSLLYRVDWTKIKDGKLEIYGWAFLENDESSVHNVYLEIRKPDGDISFYSTRKMFREGVGEHFSDDRYNYSGFYALLPMEVIDQGDNLITIFIGTDNRAGTAYTYYWDGSLR